MYRLLLAGTAGLLLYSAYRVWRHTTAERPQLRQQLPDRFAGWEQEVDRIFGGED